MNLNEKLSAELDKYQYGGWFILTPEQHQELIANTNYDDSKRGGVIFKFLNKHGYEWTPYVTTFVDGIAILVDMQLQHMEKQIPIDMSQYLKEEPK